MSGVVLVTGATGTVGREVVRRLAARRVPVRATSRRGRGLDPALPGVELRAADLAARDRLAPLLDAVRALFLVTPLEERMPEVAAGVVDAARERGVRRIVRLSALGAGPRADTGLGRVHRAVEECVEESGIAWTHLRPNSFLQNFAVYAGAEIRAAGAFRMPQGDGRVSALDVRDLAAVAVEALLADGHTARAYELTGPGAVSNVEVAAALAGACGRPIAYVDEPPAETRARLRSWGTPDWLAEILMELYAVSRESRAAQVTSAVREVLGREPTSLERFARDYAGYFV